MTFTIPHSRPFVDLQDSNAVAMQVMTGMHATGAKTEEFEKKMCSFIGMKFGKAINSGANALFISLKVLNPMICKCKKRSGKKKHRGSSYP